MKRNIKKIKQELRNFAYDPSADYWARKEEEFKKRDMTTYNTFVRMLVNDLRRDSLAIDLYMGWNNANTDTMDITEDDLFLIIGDKDGLLYTLADAISSAYKNLAGELYNDQYELADLNSYYYIHNWVTKLSPYSITNFSDEVRKTIKDFNAGLRAYARLEKSRGCRINDDIEDGLDPNIENPTLLRLYLAVQFGDYDTSHCKYSH